MKRILLLGLSLLVTGILIYYLLTHSHWTDWQQIIFQMNPFYLSWYLFLYAAGLLLRTVRYQFLLKSAQSPVLPPFGSLILVTSVRNMLVDFLPARAGSLSYIVLLNKVFNVHLSPCLSSFTYAFLFDLLAMAPLLAVAILSVGLFSHKNYPWLWVLSLMILTVALTLILFLGRLIGLFLRWYDRMEVRRLKYAWLQKVDQQIRELNLSFSTLQQARIFWPTLGLSCLIRAIKYFCFYIILSAVLEALPDIGSNYPFGWFSWDWLPRKPPPDCP